MLYNVLAHASFKIELFDSDSSMTFLKFRSFAISNLADELSAAKLHIPVQKCIKKDETHLAQNVGWQSLERLVTLFGLVLKAVIVEKTLKED